MDSRDREIAKRFRHGRVERNLSQASLAHALKLSRDQIVNIESGRAVLRTDVAHRYCEFLGVSQRWLATGIDPEVPFVRLLESLECPAGFAPNGSFSQMYDVVLRPPCDAFFSGLDQVQRKIRLIGYARPEGQRGPGTAAQEAQVLGRAVSELLACVESDLPPQVYGALWDRVHKASEDFVSEHGVAIEHYRKDISGGNDSVPAAQAIRDGADVEADTVNLALVAKASSGAQSFVLSNPHNIVDCEVEGMLNPQGVTHELEFPKEWEELRLQLVAATEAEGKKAELAEELGVTLSAVSQFRKGASRPDADKTLRMANWIRRQKPTPAKPTQKAHAQSRKGKGKAL